MMNTFSYQGDPGQAQYDDGSMRKESVGSQDQFGMVGGPSNISGSSGGIPNRKKSSDSGVGQGVGAARTSKKRTKTGCLTCRKRRIKCGEERPTCNNCVKSKRVCEGYNQRVVFKVGGFRNPSGDAVDGTGIMGLTSPTGTFDPNMVGAYTTTGRYPYPMPPTRGNQALQPIAPAPYPRRDDMNLHTQLPPHLRSYYAQQQQQQQQFHRNPSISQLSPQEHNPHGSMHELASSHSYQQNYAEDSTINEHLPQEKNPHSPGFVPHTNHTSIYHDSHQPSPYPPHPRSNSDSFIPDQLSHHTSSLPKTEGGTNSPPMASPLHHFPGRSHSFPSQAGNISPYQVQGSYPSDQSAMSPTSFDIQIDPRLESMQSSNYAEGQQQQQQQQQQQSIGVSDEQSYKEQPVVKEEKDSPLASHFNFTASAENQGVAATYYHAVEPHMGNLGSHPYQMGPSQLAQVDEAVEEDEDDDMDNDVVMEVMPRAKVSSLLAPHLQVTDHARVSFRSFLPDAGVLASYVPSSSSSPLMNPTTARIFVHWVYVLGPSISIFERHPPNPHAAFTPGAGLNGPQNVWSYTVPMLALSNSLLLHALLALSSLHIAKLSNTSLSSAHVHYHLAVRRLRKAIEDDKKRSEVATLAATLLLAYYETMAADVHKWSNHVQGAKQLLREIDFDRVTRHIEVLEEEESSSDQSPLNGADPNVKHEPTFTPRRSPSRERKGQDTLNKYILGPKADRGETKDTHKGSSQKKGFGRKDLDTSQLQSDLFWWFAKMDAFQSILSGNPLTLDYVHWGQCPPRTRIGTLGATGGSSDHLILLYGRIADFAVRDVQRKREVEKYGPAPAILEMMKAKGPPGAPPNGAPPPGSYPGSSPPNFQYGGGSPGHGPPSMNMNHQISSSPSSSNGQFPTMASNFMTDPSKQQVNSPNPSIGHQQHMPTSPATNSSSYGSPPHGNREDLEVAGMEAELEWIEIRKALTLFQDSLGEEFHPLPDGLMPAQDSPFGSPIYYRTYSIACLQLLYKAAEIILQRCHPSMPSNPMVAAGVVAKETAHIANDIGRISASLLPSVDITEISPALGGAMIELTISGMVAGVQYVDKAQRDWLVDNLMNVSRMTGWGTAERVVRGCQFAWEKAAALGKGPPYVRSDAGVQRGEEGVVDAEIGDENTYTWQIRSKRVYFAVGILGDPVVVGDVVIQ